MVRIVHNSIQSPSTTYGGDLGTGSENLCLSDGRGWIEVQNDLRDVEERMD
jgi:hypothetical protein